MTQCAPENNLVWRALADPTSATSNVEVLRFLDTRGETIDTLRREALLDEVLRAGCWLQHMGFRSGAVIALHAPVDRVWPSLFLGAIAIGAVVFPVPTTLPEPEKKRWLQGARVDATVGDALPGISRTVTIATSAIRSSNATTLHPVDDHSPAFLLTTSGTHGAPRRVLHAHGSWRGRDISRGSWSQLGMGDTLLHSASLQWSYALGLSLLDGPRHGACTLLPLQPPERSAWGPWLRKHQVTVFAGVPGLLGHLLRHHPDAWHLPPSLTRTLCAGEALDPGLARTWASHTGAAVLEAFGMTECSTYLTGLGDGLLRPQPGRRVAILPHEAGLSPVAIHAEGELAIHRDEPGLMLRYHGTVEPSRWRGPWFLTGDYARRELHGRIRILGREATRLNPGGFRVSATEVESTLLGCDGVQEVAVTEAVRGDGVRLLAACVVGDRNQEPAWRQALAARLPAWKCPRFYVLMERLPRTARGKVDRRAVAAHVQGLRLFGT